LVPRLHRLDDEIRRVGAHCGLSATAVQSVQQPVWTAALADVRLHDHPSNLIYDLEAAPATAWPATAPITSGADARHAIAVVRTWMWQNPTRVQVVHLRGCAAVADVVAAMPSSPGGQPAQPDLSRYWNRALRATRDLRGVTPHTDGIAALNTLTDLHRWLTTAVNADDAAPIATEFVELAIAMRRGQLDLARRRDAYVPNRQLRRDRSGLISQATTTWRRATDNDGPMRQLSSALQNVRNAGESPAIGQSNPAKPPLRRPGRPGRKPSPIPETHPQRPASPTTTPLPGAAPGSGVLPAASPTAQPTPRPQRSR
jgi:hypothetical protein